MHSDNKFDLNYSLVKFFLSNGRLTFLIFIFVFFGGIFATLNLKTTGFPAPTIDTFIVITRYSGASSQIVLNEVTQPLENAVKDIDGVSGYSSTSNNDISQLVLNVEADANPDSVRSQVESSLNSITLPEGANKPIIVKPDISGPDFVFSVASLDGNRQKMYESIKEFEEILNSLDQVAEVNVSNPIQKSITITPNFGRLAQSGLELSDLQNQLSTFGQSSPVGSSVTIDNKNTSITLRVDEKSIDDLKEFPLLISNSSQNQTQVSPVSIPLNQVASVEYNYDYEDSQPTFISLSQNGNPTTAEAVQLSVKAVKNTDQSLLDNLIKDTSSSADSFEYAFTPSITNSDEVYVVRNYSVNDENQAQVNEVLSGLIGSPFEINNSLLAQVGWLFGALQLVFIVMFMFVSWRAALISAFSIPLSLAITSLFLFVIGESFNTLVLFSLVLVIGLVVDPTLVVLEAIQRKIDIGLKGNDAVLKAFKDVGTGLFTSTLTNVIVFVPFGVISGVIGQIFSYIPLTIVPAIIGSYVVALVFLSYIGGVFLRKSPQSTDNEEENIWGVAKWLIALNTTILNSSVLLRLAIIVGSFVLSIGLIASFFQTGLVKQTDFSTPSDSLGILGTYTFKPSVATNDRIEISRQITQKISEYKGVRQVFPLSSSIYYIELIERKDNNRAVSSELATTINDEITKEFKDTLFDVDISASGPGGGNPSFGVSVGIYPKDLTLSKTQSTSVSKTLLDVCSKDGAFIIDANCDEDKKPIQAIDDGFTNKESNEIFVSLDRKISYEKGILDQSSFLNRNGNILQRLSASIIPLTDTKIPVEFTKIVTLQENGNSIPIVIDIPNISNTRIDSTSALSSLPLSQNPLAPQVTLDDVATIESKEPNLSIERVDGETVFNIKGKVKPEFSDQGSISAIQNAVIDYYKSDDGKKAIELGLDKDGVGPIISSQGPDFGKSIQELLIALVLAIFTIYTILVVFLNSFSKPLVVLYTIPLGFIGLVPALAFLAGGQLGFLEIIGIIILMGLVVNIALYLLDSARTYMLVFGYSEKKSIATSVGIRLRSIFLTNITAIAGLGPLAIYSEFYRSIAVVIIFGLLVTSFGSLITTPILFIFFNWLSNAFSKMKFSNKIIFLAPLTIALPLSGIISFIPNSSSYSSIVIAVGFGLSILTTFVYLCVLWAKLPNNRIQTVSAKPKQS